MDQRELAERFDAQSPRLRAVAYRILGSVAGAEDAVQEAWLRLQRADNDTIDNLASWLTRVTGRIALNMVRDGKEQAFDGFVPEPVVAPEDESNPEHAALLSDAIGFALQVVLDMLSPAERVAFVLHDMFAVPFAEIAALLERTPDSVRQLASRARRQIRAGAPIPDANLPRQRAAVNAYFAASREGDLGSLVAILDPDVVLRAHRRGAPPTVVHGAHQVSHGALAARRYAADVRPALVNGSAGVIAYQDGAPFAVLGFTVRHGRIVTIDIFNDAELVPRLLE